MYLSGTSMATPLVAGAAALMLQVNPKLTPNMVKAILMYSAQPLAGFNMLEQGAGQLNIEGAIRLSNLVRKDLNANTPVGSPFLTTSTPPTAKTTIAGSTFTWSGGLICNRTYVTGLELIMQFQGIYGLGVVMGDGVVMQVIAEGIETVDQFGRLKALGCEYGQGFLFSAPVNEVEALRLLTKDAARDDEILLGMETGESRSVLSYQM